MMQLSAMDRIVATVREDGTSPLVEELLQPWVHDPGSAYYFRASANGIALFKRDGRRQFLRFSAVTERTQAGLEAEARLVAWLDRAGVKVAAPVPSRSGRLVERVGDYYCVVFQGLAGTHLEVSDCDEAQFSAWGAALGHLHATMKRYQDPSLANRPSWREHLAQARPYVEGDPGLEAEWEDLQRWASALPTGPDDYGLIHFDFEADNLCWADGAFAILDFDDAAHHWYVADIAYALRDLFGEGVDLTDPRFKAFLRGYEGAHPLNPALLVQLPNFLRLHRMVIFARLSRALDLPAEQEGPAWLKRLEARLIYLVDAYRTSITKGEAMR